MTIRRIAGDSMAAIVAFSSWMVRNIGIALAHCTLSHGSNRIDSRVQLVADCVTKQGAEVVPDLRFRPVCEIKAAQPPLNLDGFDIIEADLPSTRKNLILEIVKLTADR